MGTLKNTPTGGDLPEEGTGHTNPHREEADRKPAELTRVLTTEQGGKLEEELPEILIEARRERHERRRLELGRDETKRNERQAYQKTPYTKRRLTRTARSEDYDERKRTLEERARKREEDEIARKKEKRLSQIFSELLKKHKDVRGRETVIDSINNALFDHIRNYFAGSELEEIIIETMKAKLQDIKVVENDNSGYATLNKQNSGSNVYNSYMIHFSQIYSEVVRDVYSQKLGQQALDDSQKVIEKILKASGKSDEEINEITLSVIGRRKHSKTSISDLYQGTVGGVRRAWNKQYEGRGKGDVSEKLTSLMNPVKEKQSKYHSFREDFLKARVGVVLKALDKETT